MKFNEFNPVTDLKFKEYNNKFISLVSDVDETIRVQIPRMYMPFGLSGFTPDMGATKWNIDFSLKGWDEEDNYVNTFYKWIKNVEDSVIEHISNKSCEIFGGVHKTSEELRGMLNSNLKESQDGREPKFRAKVDTYPDGNIKVPIFDEDEQSVKTKAEVNLYSRHSGVSIVELTSVYFMNKKFGLVWKLNQMKYYEPQRLKGFHFQIDES